MNDQRKEPAEKRPLADALLALDGLTPSSSAEGREMAQAALRRDRRRVRILTWMTSGLFLLTFLGICFSVWFYYQKMSPAFKKYERDIAVVYQQLAKREPPASEPDLLDITAQMTAGGGYALFVIQFINLWGILAVLAVMLLAAFCTVLLIMASRRATLGQIQVSLLALSEQFDALQRSLQNRQTTGGGQATQAPGG
jgi:type VI protein secretion system component VasF